MPAQMPGFMNVSLAPETRTIYRHPNSPRASLKRIPEDFRVEEIWQPNFSGEGEHLYLLVEKTEQNTPWVAKQLSRAFAVSEKSVGYSGLKDRQAITRQWFSLPVPANRADKEPEIEGVRIVKRGRHSSKLRRGTHAENSFEIRLRDLVIDQDSPFTERGSLEEILTPSLKQLTEQGFPNYFGSQRFGHNGNNLKAGQQLARRRKLVGHPKRGIYLSAMRSSLFNQVLTAQIDAGNWSQICAAPIKATGPMWGRGRPAGAELGGEVEALVIEQNSALCDILEHGGLSQERRALRQVPKNLEWAFEAEDLLLSFSLPPGSYATVLIDELVALRTE